MGVFDWLNEILGNVRGVINTALVVLGLIIAIGGSIKRPTISGIIMACIGGALVATIGVLIVSFSGLFEAELALILL